MPPRLINPFTLQNVFLELAVSEYCVILRLNVQPAKTFRWHTTVQNACICVWRETLPCWELAYRETSDLSGHRETAAEPESFSKWFENQQLSGISVAISCLNNLPMSYWNAKKTSYETTNVSYLFPFGASQQKQNNIIRAYAMFLEASNSSLTNGYEVKAYCPLPFMKMGFECSPLFLIVT